VSPGPTYFTHDGLILFMKNGAAAWRPHSFFAHRIATYPPGQWFVETDPSEQQAFGLVAQTAVQEGWSAKDAATMMKVMELRNDGSIIHW